MRLRILDCGLWIGAAVLAAGTAISARQPPARSGNPSEPARVASIGETMRPQLRGTHGIVAAGRHYSVAAGVQILQQGGNAVDAGVATVFAASICEISHFGFGGESPAMIYDAKTKEIIVI